MTKRSLGRAAGAAALSLCLAGAQFAAAAPAAGPVVQTDLGKIRGERQGAGAAFRGVPYAAPPVGPLRWRPTQEASPWTGVRAATDFGPSCPQPVMGPEKVGPQSEDCLTLNVLTPNLKGRKLPVLVSIHGGAYFVGSGRIGSEAGVSALVRRGVVVVSPNYRLGWLGFFSHPGPRAEGGDAGNYWLMDQIAALKWVKRNIARFGGDPDNVTILGCSAGGSSVNALMVSPAARGLFEKASVHSGGGLFNATHPLAEKEKQGLAFAESLGVNGEDADALARLRAVPVERIVAAETQAPPDFGPVIDGRLLPDQIAVLYAQGRQAHVPLVMGSTDNEASIFGLMGFDQKTLADRFGVDVPALRPAYEAGGALGDKELLRQVQTDFIFTAASQGLAAFAAQSGQPTYAYNFGYVPTAERGQVAGAPHCADMAFMLGDGTPREPGQAGPAPSAPDRALARTLQDYLVRFLRTGDPNGPGLPAWPRYAPPHPATLVVGDPVKAVTDFRARQLAPWFVKWSAETGRPPPP
jgi:para-nitrobenzyl esterase